MLEEEEEALTFLQALDNKDRGKVRQRPEQYNNNAQMQTLDEEEEALCLQKALDDFNAKFQEKREMYKHTCKKRVMLRRRLFWPKKNCGKSA